MPSQARVPTHGYRSILCDPITTTRATSSPNFLQSFVVLIFHPYAYAKRTPEYIRSRLANAG